MSADSYSIIDGQVVPYYGGRKSHCTDSWRDATPLELQLQEELQEAGHTIEALRAQLEAAEAEVVLERKLKAASIHACALANIHAELPVEAAGNATLAQDLANNKGS